MKHYEIRILTHGVWSDDIGVRNHFSTRGEAKTALLVLTERWKPMEFKTRIVVVKEAGE